MGRHYLNLASAAKRRLGTLALLVRARIDDALATLAESVARFLDAAQLSLLPPVLLLLRDPEADLALNRSLVSMHGVAALLVGTRMIGRSPAPRMLEPPVRAMGGA